MPGIYKYKKGNRKCTEKRHLFSERNGLTTLTEIERLGAEM